MNVELKCDNYEIITEHIAPSMKPPYPPMFSFSDLVFKNKNYTKESITSSNDPGGQNDTENVAK